MTDLTTINMPARNTSYRSAHLSIRVIVISGVLAGAALLAGHAIGQQSADTQMPQAPKAPSMPSLEPTEPAFADDHKAQQGPEIGGELQLTLQQAEGQDGPDDDNLRRDTGQAEIQLTLELEQKLGSSAKFVSRLELSTLRYSEEDLINDDEEFAYDLERFYLDFRPTVALRLRAGRQGISDPMEAIIDADLDGLMLSYNFGQFEFKLSHTREDWFEASSFDRDDQITYNTMASLEFTPTKKTVWMPYVLHRSDDNGDEPVDVTLMGMMAIVEPYDTSLRYWIHGSLQDGEERDEDEVTELGGFAIDAGFNWTAPIALNPTFTLAAAHASGVTKPNRHRQSGLHSNDFALNTKNTFRYLGEVLDPELTNIEILTLGIGADLTDDLAIDVAVHSYKQVEPSDSLRGTDLRYKPAGNDDDLGSAVDLIVSYDPSKRLKIQGTAGVFLPGSAFEQEPDTAWLTALELEYSF